MATNSKVFVSPGVYTSEVDLSFVAQSVGVTTLGIVGETLIGPAFEPIFIRTYDEFTTYFGGSSPEKFINTQIPKYEAAYIAKAYLQQSNQLFVTRILGLSGYDAGPSWSITTIANLDPTTLTQWCTSAYTNPSTCQTTCATYKSDLSYNVTFTGCSNGIGSVSFLGNFPAEIQNILTNPYELYNGSTSSMDVDIKTQIEAVINASGTTSGSSIYYFGSLPHTTYIATTGYTASTNVFGVPSVDYSLTDPTNDSNDVWYYATFVNNGTGLYTGYSFYNTVSSIKLTTTSSNCALFNSFSISGVGITQTSGTIDYTNNTITVCLPSGATVANLTGATVYYNSCTTGVTSNIGGVSYTAAQNKGTGETRNFSAYTGTYTLTSSDGSVTNVWTVNITQATACIPCSNSNNGSGNSNIVYCYSGSVAGKISYFSGYSYSEYDNLVVATLRSRGLATYSSDNGAVYEVSGITNAKLVGTGAYSAITKNPFAEFKITGTTIENTSFGFESSLSISDVNFISKVFGTSNFQKPKSIVPLFVEEEFNNLLVYAYRKGYIRGLNTSFTALPGARQQVDPSSIGWYMEKYQTAESPYVVSELRGNKVYNLFKFVMISDGDSSNTQVKISIANMSFDNLTFDVLVRDFYDNDSAPVVIEKYTNCTMDPGSNSFIAKKIGTSNGEYELNSKYIMVEMNEDAPIDAIPSGFQGYTFRTYDHVTSPFPIYKTKYDYPGEVIYNPPFGAANGSVNSVTSGGDNVRKTYLGISDTIGYDPDFLAYKGKQLPNNICTAVESTDWAFKTKGFHMDKDASVITIGNSYTTSGDAAFEVGSATFNPQSIMDVNNPYYRIYARKFTLMVRGGFDGWDIYREYRTNTDRFALGQSGYLKGACYSTKYPTATGWGAFKQIAVGDNTVDYANTDYYAYLLGINSFSNPEAVNINVLVTPGIDYINNSNLVESTIEMVETQRADSLYVCTTPDVNLYLPSVTAQDLIYPQDAVDSLTETGIDSNYTATYYPWVLTRDTVNNTQIYIPATAEVTRNLALTDNIAFPWFAAAGYTRGIVNAVKARKKLTQEDRDVLYQGRINPIATFSDVGTVIWGNKTLQIRQSALDRINVRRLLLQARKLISAVSVRLLFEQNDDKVRQDFLDAVNPILDAIRRDRGLYDFRVTVSNDTADLDRNQMTGKIYIKPTRSLEFIDITFYITPTGASFENI
jgi:hypothetical protein